MSGGSERIKDYYRSRGEVVSGTLVDPFAYHHYSLKTQLTEARANPPEVSEDWESGFEEAVSDLFDILAERQAESTARLHTLERELAHLKQQLVQRSTSILVPIETFEPEPYIPTREVTALVLADDDSFVASLVDASINASGDTIPEAIANLKEMMIRLFERLSREPEAHLGRGPKRQLAVLHGLMRRKARHAAHHQRAR